MSFAEWLQGVRASDPDEVYPYAPMYEVADDLKEKFGGNFDHASIVTWLRERFPDGTDLPYTEALVQAEANWRLDTLVIGDPQAMETAAEVVKEKDPVVEIVKKDLPGMPSVGIIPCGFRSVTGDECPRNAVLGAARCVAHGGMILDPEVRRSLLVSAYAKLQSNIEFGIETLLDVMESSRNDIARVQAANSLLDRAGMTVEQQVVLSDVNNVLDQDAKSKEVIRRLTSKLDATRDRLRLTAVPVESREVDEA